MAPHPPGIEEEWTAVICEEACSATHRFFVRPDDVGTEELRLRGDEADHLARVLRLGRARKWSSLMGVATNI